MKPLSHYLAFKRINDKLIALDKNQNLIMWRITTGKTKMIKQIKRDLGLADYEVYEMQQSGYSEKSVNLHFWSHNEHNQKGVLLKTKSPIKDGSSSEERKKHFGVRYRPSIAGGRNIIDISNLSFYRFKVIEIMSSEEVVEHMNFVHAYFIDD